MEKEIWLQGLEVIFDPELNINEPTLIAWVHSGYLSAYDADFGRWQDLRVESLRSAVHIDWDEQCRNYSVIRTIHCLYFRKSEVIAAAKATGM